MARSKEEFISIGITKLKQCQKVKDKEVAHKRADRILCSILSRLDLFSVVQEYRKVPKWYS